MRVYQQITLLSKESAHAPRRAAYPRVKRSERHTAEDPGFRCTFLAFWENPATISEAGTPGPSQANTCAAVAGDIGKLCLSGI